MNKIVPFVIAANFLINVYIFSTIFSFSVQTAHAQAQLTFDQQKDAIRIDDAKKYTDKIQLIASACAGKITDDHPYLTDECRKVIEDFDLHMKQLFNGTHTEMESILVSQID